MLNSVRAVVFGYNSAQRIEKVLGCLAGQKIPYGVEYSILVMTNAPHDDTMPVALQYWNKIGNPYSIQFLHEQKEGLVYSREKAIAACDQDILIFVDDDNYLKDDYIYLAYNTFSENTNTGIVCGQNFPLFKSEVPEWYVPFQHVLAVGKQGAQTGDITNDKGFAWGAGMCIRNEFLKLIFDGGFSFTKINRNGRLMSFADDYELSLIFKLAGFKIYYVAEMHLHHEIPAHKLNQNYLKEINFSQGYSSVILDAINYQLKPLKVNRLNILKIWLKELLYCYKTVLSKKHAEDLSNELRIQYYKGRLKNLFDYKAEYYRHFKTVERIKQTMLLNKQE